MAVFRCPRYAAASNMNPVLVGTSDQEGSIKPIIHKLKEVLLAIRLCFTRVTAPARKKQTLVKAGSRNRRIDAEHPRREGGRSEDIAEYYERRKAELMNWTGYM